MFLPMVACIEELAPGGCASPVFVWILDGLREAFRGTSSTRRWLLLGALESDLKLLPVRWPLFSMWWLAGRIPTA